MPPWQRLSVQKQANHMPSLMCTSRRADSLARACKKHLPVRIHHQWEKLSVVCCKEQRTPSQDYIFLPAAPLTHMRNSRCPYPPLPATYILSLRFQQLRHNLAATLVAVRTLSLHTAQLCLSSEPLLYKRDKQAPTEIDGRGVAYGHISIIP